MKNVKYSYSRELKMVAKAVGVSPMRLVTMVSNLLSAGKCSYTRPPILVLEQYKELFDVSSR